MKKKVYVVVMIEGDEEGGLAVEPLGVYTSEDKAIEYAKKLDDLTPRDSEFEAVYDVFDFYIDVEPFMLTFMKKQKEAQTDVIQDLIIDLMKEGMVDQLIGEDGHFYYTLTDLGQKTYNQMKGGVPEHVKKFLRKNQEED